MAGLDVLRHAAAPSAPLGARNLLTHLIDGAGGHLANARPLPEARGEAQLPAAFTELEREWQLDRGGGRGGRGRLEYVGRGLHRDALLVEWNLREA
jgi:hypothetical protein